VDYKRFYLSAQGRVNRKQWWLYLVLPIFVVSVILRLIDNAIGMVDQESGAGLLSGLWAFIILIPWILVSIKRWHDHNKSGWWMLIPLVPIVGAIWFLIELGFLKGTEGPNRFGPPVTT